MTELESLNSRIEDIQKEIKKVFDELEDIKEQKYEELLKNEEPYLIKRFNFVIKILTALIVITALTIGLSTKLKLEIIWICISAGILGSSISALISALQRKANGWEFNNGMKYPSDSSKDKFSMRMSMFFVFRPLLGIMSGLIIFYGYRIIFYDIEEAINHLNSTNLIFWSLLAGLFAKSLIEKLKQIFDNLIGIK